MSDLIVCKYGGTSVDSVEDIDIIRKITEDDARRRVIVVSAPAGVTDLLIRLTKARDDAILSSVIDRYVAAHPANAKPEEIHASLVERLECALPENERADHVKAFGEYMSAKLIADSLGYDFVDAADMLDVTSCFGNAEIEPSSAEKAQSMLGDTGKRYVVTGFYGMTAKGGIATFSRGGSDLTGAYLAAALEARLYENFTDRRGVFTADPKIVPGAMMIPFLTFKEMRDLAYSGAKIFHSDAILPIEDKLDCGQVIPVHIRSAKEYPLKGTFIEPVRKSEDQSHPIVGLAYGDKFCSFDIDMRGLNNLTGVEADIKSIFKALGLSIEHTPTGIDDLSVILRKDELDAREDQQGADASMESIVVGGLKKLLGKRAQVRFQEHMGCLVVAGKDINEDPTAVSRRMLQALENAKIKIVFTSMGPSRSCIINGIPSRDKENAMRAVHYEFFGQ